MVEKLKAEVQVQVAENVMNDEKIKEIQDVADTLVHLRGSDVVGYATQSFRASLEELRMITEYDISTAEQSTAHLDEQILEEHGKTETVINATESLNSSTFDIEKGELEESAKEQAEDLEDLHEELTGESFDKSVDSAIKRMIDKSVKTDHLPSEKNGEWVSGKRGDGIFVLNDDARIFVKKGVYITGKEIKEKYREQFQKIGAEGVIYSDNEPDFSPFAHDSGFVTTIEIPKEFGKMPTDRKNGTYDIAVSECAQKFGVSEEQVRKYMKDNGLTWHESADRKHIIPVPTEINAAFKHTGGISKQKSFEKLSQRIDNQTGGSPIKLYRTSDSLESDGLNKAIKGLKKK